MSEVVQRSENDLLVFISSRMNCEMKQPRIIAVEAIGSVEFGRPWAFEHSPASSDSADDSYLRKVREADFVVWLVGSETTQPVIREINEAIAYGRRLLVFKLPSSQRDDNTLNLLEHVGDYSKWQDVSSLEDLSEHILKSMSDEIIRGLRNPASPTRNSKLSQEFRLSLSRCKDVWISLGVEEHIAVQMAEECSLGNVLDIPSPGMYTIVDVQGIGKTLAAERLFQRAVKNAIADSSQPFPLFVNARELNEPVRDYIERSIQGNGDPYDPRIILIIDGVDELGATRAIELYHQIKVYVDANQRATLLTTARSLPGLEVMGKEIQLSKLTQEGSVDLIARVSGHVLEPRDTHRWSESVRDAVRLPLFALMVGALLRDDPRLILATPGQIIEILANKALQQVHGNSEELDLLLQILAVKAIDQGTRVPLSSITPKLAKQRLLRDSRLIEQSSGEIDFTLPIFREWYASRALIEGTVSVKHLHQNSDRWLPALSVVLNSGHDNIRNSLMRHLISTDAGLACLLIEEHNRNFRREEFEILELGTSEDVGTKIRQAMSLWRAGLGDLFEQIGPIGRNGEIATLGVALSEGFLTTSWYAGDSILPPVVELEGVGLTSKPTPEWPSRFSSSLSSRTRDPFWWSYVESFEDLARSLSEILHRSNLVMCSSDAIHELSWGFVTNAIDHYHRRSNSVQLDDALRSIEALLGAIEPYGSNASVRGFRGWAYDAKEIKAIAEYLSDLVNKGRNEIPGSMA